MKKTKNLILQLVKVFDIFGKPITLNFDQKGDTHKSLFGSIMSVILASIILAFAGSRASIMFNREKSTSNSLIIPQDPITLGTVDIQRDA